MKNFLFIFVAIAVCQAVPPEGLNEGFREVALGLHNDYRLSCGLEILQLDNELNVIAQEHALNLANSGTFKASNRGYAENLWAYHGQQRALNVDTRDAVNTWYTGRKIPEDVEYQADPSGIYSNSVKYLGIGVETHGDYTVVVAEYH